MAADQTARRGVRAGWCAKGRECFHWVSAVEGLGEGCGSWVDWWPAPIRPASWCCLHSDLMGCRGGGRRRARRAPATWTSGAWQPRGSPCWHARGGLLPRRRARPLAWRPASRLARPGEAASPAGRGCWRASVCRGWRAAAAVAATTTVVWYLRAAERRRWRRSRAGQGGGRDGAIPAGRSAGRRARGSPNTGGAGRGRPARRGSGGVSVSRGLPWAAAPFLARRGSRWQVSSVIFYSPSQLWCWHFIHEYSVHQTVQCDISLREGRSVAGARLGRQWGGIQWRGRDRVRARAVHDMIRADGATNKWEEDLRLPRGNNFFPPEGHLLPPEGRTSSPRGEDLFPVRSSPLQSPTGDADARAVVRRLKSPDCQVLTGAALE